MRYPKKLLPKSTVPELIDDELTTAKLWADRIISDLRAHARGAPKQYPTPPEWDAIKGEGHLLDLPTAAGKPLRECTFRETGLLGAAYKIAADHFKAVDDARQLLAAEVLS
jgi:hypothetical protein